MVHVSKERVIPAGPERVWQFIADPEKERQWRSPQIAELRKLEPGPIRVGDRYVGKTVLFGKTGTYTTEITEVEPAKKVAWKGVNASGPMVADGYYLLEAMPNGSTRFTIDMKYHPTNLAGRLQQPVIKFMGPRILKQFEDTLTRMVH